VNDQRTVELPEPGYGRRHEMEIPDYHVRGWVLAGCVTYGTEDIGGDPGRTAAAAAAAEQCRRRIRLPGAPAPHSLRPLLIDRGDGNGWVFRDKARK
jgi:hypothetical protein